MRKLTEREIDLLVEQGCSAENWLGIEVEDDDSSSEMYDASSLRYEVH